MSTCSLTTVETKENTFRLYQNIVNTATLIRVSSISWQQATVCCQHLRWKWSSRERKFNYSDVCWRQPSIGCHTYTLTHLLHCPSGCYQIWRQQQPATFISLSSVFLVELWQDLLHTHPHALQHTHNLSDNLDLRWNVPTDAILSSCSLPRICLLFRGQKYESNQIDVIRLSAYRSGLSNILSRRETTINSATGCKLDGLLQSISFDLWCLCTLH